MVKEILKLSIEPEKSLEQILKKLLQCSELPCMSNGKVTPNILLIQAGIYIENTNTLTYINLK